MEKAKIREAWESVLKIHFHLIEKGVDSEGWYSNQRNDQWLPLQGDDMKLYDFRNDNTEVRPKSLNEAKTMEWIDFDTATKAEKMAFNEIDQSRVLMFYDTREVAWLTDENLPRAIATHYLIVPKFPLKK